MRISKNRFKSQRLANKMSKKALYRHKKSGDLFAIVREDKTPGRQGNNASFLRLKATENELTVSGDRVSATFPATVNGQRVLFGE